MFDSALSWLYELVGTMLSWFSSLFGGSYALALLLYALLFKLLFLPFSIRQQKNQIKMAKLTPKIQLIRAKYKGRNDQASQQKMQQEIMEFQQKEGYSPFSGCLPLLLQFPIIIFLYSIIRNPLSYICKITDTGVRAITKFLLENNIALDIKDLTIENVDTFSFKSLEQIKIISGIYKYGSDNISIEGVDLSNLPDFHFLGLNLADIPSIQNLSWLVLIPIIAAALTWLSMFLTRKWNGNPNDLAGQDGQAQMSMKMMDLMMPAMTLFIAFGFSGMLGVYWIYQSALGILQTFIISRTMPLPRFTEEEIKEMRKAEKAAEKAQRAHLKEAPKYRSLHYIDDDDYDTLPEMKSDDNGKKNAPTNSDIPEIKD